MDMSFANQALGAEYLMRNVENLAAASFILYLPMLIRRSRASSCRRRV